MGPRKGFEISADMAEVRRDIERWRATRAKRSPMPERLWEAAAALAQRYGIYRTARALHVSYESLKYRTGSRAGGRQNGTTKPLAVPFVELRPAKLTTSPTPARGAEVEVMSAHGERMMIRLGADEHVDLLGLANVFLGRGA